MALLPPAIAVILDALGAGEQRRVYDGRSKDLPYLAHRTAHGLQKRRTRVFHQMPAVGNLNSLWGRSRCRLTTSTTEVARDDGDLGVISQQTLHRSGIPIWQQIDD